MADNSIGKLSIVRFVVEPKKLQILVENGETYRLDNVSVYILFAFPLSSRLPNKSICLQHAFIVPHSYDGNWECNSQPTAGLACFSLWLS
jgi:hypothetical protein